MENRNTQEAKRAPERCIPEGTDVAQQTSTPAEEAKREPVPIFAEKIGRTLFAVSICFNEDSKETMDDKVRRLVRKDMENHT